MSLRIDSLASLSASVATSVIALVLVAGCPWRDNPNHCPDTNPNNSCHDDEPDQTCTSNTECRAPTGVCDVGGTMTCVQCTADERTACTETTPVCGDDHECRGCTAHAQCEGSAVCLPDGACADSAQVAYVKPLELGGTDNSSCTLMLPCTKVTSALQTGRPYVKLAGTNDEGDTITIDGRTVALLAEPGAKLVRSTGGVVVEVRGTSQVEIDDLEISGVLHIPGIGISMPPGNTAKLTLRRVKLLGHGGKGISATEGVLKISQSTISGNADLGISAAGGALTISQSTVARNMGGGISVMSATFAIVGNVFFSNGTSSALTGGVSISAPANAANRLEFNSFHKNTTTSGVAPAIRCTVAGAFTAQNNIMSENGPETAVEQFDGNCQHAYSIVRPGTLPPGTRNSSMDPLFVSTPTGDLHLKAGSPALGAANPSADLRGLAERDLDGDVRASPADIGADEVP